MEHSQKIGYLGPKGTFSHQAAQEAFGKHAELIEQKSITSIFEAVYAGSIDIGLVPAENSINGIVSQTFSNLIEYPFYVSGSYTLAVKQNLLSKTAHMEDIRIIKSHEQPLGQCRSWIKEHYPDAELSAYPSTVAAIQSESDEHTAFIGSLGAAKEYGLYVLAEDIAETKTNETKFYLLTREKDSELIEKYNSDRTLLLLAVRDRVGVLHDILGVFEKYNLNLTGLHSIASALKDWDYYFYFEINCHLDSESMQSALEEITPYCSVQHIIGQD